MLCAGGGGGAAELAGILMPPEPPGMRETIAGRRDTQENFSFPNLGSPYVPTRSWLRATKTALWPEVPLARLVGS